MRCWLEKKNNQTMIKKLLLYVFIVAAFASCNKDKYVVEYVVDCDNCTVSYWDENNTYVARIPASGNWTYSFEGTQDNKISVAAQSDFFLDSATTCYNFNCPDSIADTLSCWDLSCAESLRPSLYDQMLNDSIYVSVKVDGKVMESASQGNREFAAAWVEIFLD
jgi:hypothetical protein